MRFVCIYVTKAFSNLNKILCNVNFFLEMFFVKVSQTRRCFLIWSTFHNCCHLTRKNLCHVFLSTFSSSCFFFLYFFWTFIDHLCFFSFDVFMTQRRRLSREVVNRFLILLQKLNINATCLFFIRCRNLI
jgi:hypothetical protein